MREREREHAFTGFLRPAFSGLSSSYTMEPFMPPAVIITMCVKCREVKEKKTENMGFTKFRIKCDCLLYRYQLTTKQNLTHLKKALT